MFINLSEAVPANQATAGIHRDNYGHIVAQYNRIHVLVNMDTVKHLKRIDEHRTVLFFIDGSDMKVIETPEQIDAILYPATTLAYIGSNDAQGESEATVANAPKKRGRKPKNHDAQ